MRIALTADPDLPVPPKLYGGLERIVDMLARGLVERGHDVTLFAHPDSDSAGRLVPWPGRSALSKADTIKNAALLTRHVIDGGYDLVHSNSRLAYLGLILPFSTAKIMTYHRAISPRTVRWGHAFSQNTLSFTAISEWMMEPVKHIGRWTKIPNGVSLETFKYIASIPPNAPMVFLGRIEEIKGPHLAIEIARRTGRRLVIAGNIPEEKKAWVDRHVMPFVDGLQISYVGPVDDRQKNELLGTAAALLMPILWDEPFGIVMIEAMACGTPVLGLSRGAVPEVVADGITGFVRAEVDQLVQCVGRIETLDRAAARLRVEQFYSQDAVVEAYLALYRDRLSARRTA